MGGRKVVLGASRIAQGGSKSARGARITALGLGESKIARAGIKLGGSKIVRGAIKLGGSRLIRAGSFLNICPRRWCIVLIWIVMVLLGWGRSARSKIVRGAIKIMGMVIALCICCHLLAMVLL